LAKVGRNGKYLECSTASPDIIIKHREPHHDYVLRCLNIVLRELGHRDFFLLLITMQNAASCHYIHNPFSSLKTPFFHTIPKNKSQIQPDSHSLKGSRQWCCHTIHTDCSNSRRNFPDMYILSFQHKSRLGSPL